MKAILMAVALFVSIGAFSQAKGVKKATFKVEGACSMCKKHIETAATGLAGVSSAVWNKDTKVFTVLYQPGKVSVDSIQSKIAAAGYDTPKFRGNDNAYEELDECCKYDRTTGINKKTP